MNKLQQLREEAIKKHEDLLAFIDRQQDLLGPLLDEAEKLNPQNVYIDNGYASISITGDRHALNAAFGLLRRHGYNTDERPEKGKSQYSSFFTKPETPGMVFLNFSSTQCRRVKTGTVTKTVTEDVYEIVCDEQEYPERAEKPVAAKAEAEELPF